jgi:hypothetical protein
MQIDESLSYRISTNLQKSLCDTQESPAVALRKLGFIMNQQDKNQDDPPNVCARLP